MITMYLISAYFDEKANKKLQRYIDIIAEKTGNRFLTDNNVPPHMTISAIEARNDNVLVPSFQGLNDMLVGGNIQFVSVGQLFPYVMYVTPVLNEYLMKLQMKVFDAVKNIDETYVSRLYMPYSWLPHVTIGKKLDKDQMNLAFNIMRENFVPFDAKVCGIGLAKVNPHEDIIRYKLV